MHSKKGLSGHIEVIISFLIFLAFVSFLLFFVNPIEKNKETTHYLEMTENAITEYLKANLSEFSITLVNPPGGAAAECRCFNYNNPPEKIGNLLQANDIIVKTKDGIITPGAKNANQICFETVGVEKFYRLYFSEEFDGAAPGALCAGVLPMPASDYTLGVYNEYEKVSNNSLSALENDYDASYASYINLRDNTLKLNADFNIFVKNMRNEYLAYSKIKEPKGNNIMAKDISIEIINNTGGIIPAIMNIQVWE
ncbi:hypothetical protein A3K73_07405 [Candidatus Pacearchaeota archaeon RBG_13_36_9]|nr:MAG: hypothetical protein A3K73_07405 [Candidatus Pacearchaeota archaeon RBG_13_36_9]